MFSLSENISVYNIIFRIKTKQILNAVMVGKYNVHFITNFAGHSININSILML